MNRIIIIQGPTASGKSSLTLDLAQELNIPIVSADSRQFYKEMSIGTAKPSMSDQKKAPHYFIDTHSINELTLTSAGFMKQGRSKIAQLFEEGASDIIVSGGSGMFVDALIEGLHESPNDPEIRSKLHNEWKRKGMEPLLEELKSNDPNAYKNIDRNNPMRVLRALEIVRVSGKTLEEIRQLPKEHIGCSVIRFSIAWKREDLYTRINERVDQMVEAGLFEEVEKLKVHENLLLQNTVGYKEWSRYFEKEASFKDTVELIQKNSRNYAKRQETWLKRYDHLISLNPYDSLSLKAQLLAHLQS